MSEPTQPRKTPARTTSRPAAFADLVALLPERIDEWACRRPDRLCDHRTIYDYMDGAAEVYLIYAFAGLVVRSYHRKGQPTIIVELFDMTTGYDAFGVFTNGRDEDLPDAKIGQGAELREGLLTFWQDRYFVAVRVDALSVPPSVSAMLPKLGRSIATAIGKTAPLPDVLGALPDAGLVAHSVRYFYKSGSLNYHYDFGDKNILHLTPKAQAILATYRLDKARCYLLCVQYPTAATATRARRDFIAGFARNADRQGAAKIDNDLWTAVATEGRFLTAALDIPTRTAAIQLAGRAVKRYRATRPNLEQGAGP